MPTLKKSSFQYGISNSIENGFLNLNPSWDAETQGPGLKFPIQNEHFKPRLNISNENVFCAWGKLFVFKRLSENIRSISAPSGFLGNRYLRS